MKLKGRVALVTGAGSGIGRAIAARFHLEGARVVLNDVDGSRAEETAIELGLSPRTVVVADVSDASQVRRMFETASGVDVLVNNAGFAEIEKTWNGTAALGDGDWRRMLGVHLDGTFHCTREALKRMRNGGVILNVSSTAALTGLAEAPHYAAAKAGILGFTRSVAREVAARGIRVNAIAPGYTETAMTEALSRERRESLRLSIPLGRFAQPSEIAAVALFLCCDDSSYVTGQCLSPNGGLVMSAP